MRSKQAGLSWSTILAKRDTLCETFDHFNPQTMVTYDDNKVAELLQNNCVIKNKLKIKAAINNAQTYF
ncbi:MAG: DNA-3-methyladenine glycosylase I [Gilliamella sp.]|nr:DNA-3-methyladenine glycosylase I [Gilliamella sp.]MCO6557754.1 DNA-3-methyladenine glycosylase I [Gilliamella sp.]